MKTFLVYRKKDDNVEIEAHHYEITAEERLIFRGEDNSILAVFRKWDGVEFIEDVEELEDIDDLDLDPTAKRNLNNFYKRMRA